MNGCQGHGHLRDQQPTPTGNAQKQGKERLKKKRERRREGRRGEERGGEGNGCAAFSAGEAEAKVDAKNSPDLPLPVNKTVHCLPINSNFLVIAGFRN
jgi:hypothetical protein